MSKGPGLSTQFIVFILFGDIIGPRGGWVWTTSLLQMLSVLDVSERAARSTLSRMYRKGFVRPKRDGRHSLYTLTARGRQITDEGGYRIFEPRRREWDGQWHMVVYSLPEQQRGLRSALRKRLAWLGYGPLVPGTWISPHNRSAEVGRLLEDLDARSNVQMFSGLRLAGGDDRVLVGRCWDIKGLNQQYARFVHRWEPKYEKCAAALIRGDGPSPAECFGQRFWITHEYSPFPRLDPNLPQALLPDDWSGDKASEIFQGFRGLLNARSTEFIDSTFQRPNGHRT
jgi:phenylacetic acid degradation operon negative regulatory protein